MRWKLEIYENHRTVMYTCSLLNQLKIIIRDREFQNVIRARRFLFHRKSVEWFLRKTNRWKENLTPSVVVHRVTCHTLEVGFSSNPSSWLITSEHSSATQIRTLPTIVVNEFPKSERVVNIDRRLTACAVGVCYCVRRFMLRFAGRRVAQLARPASTLHNACSV